MNTAQAQLGPVLAAAGQELAELLERTEGRLAEVTKGHGDGLGHHAGGTLAAGGKRLRPMLVFLCAATPDERLVAGGAAVELLHMATLVHDDVLTAPSCAAAGRPSSPTAGVELPPRRGTCSSRARSPSWRRPGATTLSGRSRTRRPRSRAASSCSARTHGART